MKGTVRVNSGSLKGRVIPFHISRSDNADITPQKVKGALFSLLGERLSGKTFIDLFSGSGQIGIEAISRDCGLVVFNDRDSRLIERIKVFLKQTCSDKNILLLNLHAASAVRYLSQRKISADIVFIDPPYVKGKGSPDFYISLLDDIAHSGILNDSSILIVQHFSINILPETSGCLIKTDIKKYGSTSLSIYCIDHGTGDEAEQGVS